MTPADTLETVAEIAIALAGFSGIVAVLGGRARGSWSDVDRLRLSLLLATSFGVVLWSFAPIVLFAAKISAERVWLAVSGTYVVYLLALALYRVRQMLAVARSHPEIRDLRYIALLVTGTVAVIAVQLANALSLRTLWPHLVALLWALLIGFLQFVRLLRATWANEPAA